MIDTLKYLIKEEISKILSEADDVPAAASDPSTSPTEAPAIDSSTDTAPDTAPDLSAAPGGSEVDLGDTGGNSAAGGDAGGGDMGGGFGGGGGGLGKIGDSSEGGGEPTSGGEGSVPETLEPTEPDESKTPEEQIMSTAKDIAEKTNDVQKTIKSIKHLIQLRYNKPSDAADVVLKLYNEKDNPVLQSAARRLAMFITGK